MLSLKDLGEAKSVLGIRVRTFGTDLRLDQTSCIENVLEKFNIEHCKPVATPYTVGQKLKKAKKNDDRPYQQFVGCLNFLAVCTRPDISQTVSYLSKFNNCHDESHWLAAKRLLRYLKGTINYSLTYIKDQLRVTGLVDADIANDNSNRKSYSGYIFLMGNGAICWESKKQSLVAMSTSEAEYIALSESCKEAKFIKMLIKEIANKEIDIDLYNDNQSAILWSHDQRPYSRTKHIDIRNYFV
ncbi:uncharacterized protein [Prorops nasuta]|uniref:uncharacterized protein n=1 Tax=Prorops nasuta TaxID=863751 RepID=UPI0034CE3D28